MQVLAEAVGTFILVFCICGIIASMELMKGQIGLMEYATTAALTVVVVVYAIGTISGAHVNPAITIAFATVGPFPWSTVHTPFQLSTSKWSFHTVIDAFSKLLSRFHFIYQHSLEVLSWQPMQESLSMAYKQIWC